MSQRFLFLNPEGREVGASSLEELAEHFRAGRLTEGALFYDGETGEWGPLRGHPLFPAIMGAEKKAVQKAQPAPEAAQAPPAPPPPADDLPALASADDLPDITLADPDEAGESVQEFLQARAQERAEDAMRFEGAEREIAFVDPGQASTARHATDFASGSHDDSGARKLPDAAEMRPPASTPPPAPPQRPDSWEERGSPSRAAGEGEGWTSTEWSSEEEPLDRAAPTPSRTRRRRSPEPVSAVRQGVLFAALLAVGGWGIADSWGAPLDASNDFSERPVVLPPPGPAPLAAPAREAQSAAFRDMVQGMDQLRARIGLGEPPALWMSGEYLGDAGAYPEVPAYWETYASFVDSLAVAEEALFRRGFLERMESEGIEGPIQAIRLTRALEEFKGDGERRRARYDAMRRLSAEALALHAYLVERTEAIEYTPAEIGLADDAVLEVSFATDDEGAALWARVDLLTDALEGVVGPDPLESRNVAQRVLESLAGS